MYTYFKIYEKTCMVQRNQNKSYLVVEEHLFSGPVGREMNNRASPTRGFQEERDVPNVLSRNAERAA